MSARNARLLVVKMPPYAQTTPWHGGHESQALLSAAGGVAWRQSSTDGGPIDSVFPHLLYVQGLWATVCTVAALIEREKSGFGQTVSVTGINAVMEAAVGAFTVNPDNPDPSTAVGTGGRHPTYTRYATKDGQWIACGALGGKFETWLINALGLGDMLKEERMGGNIANIVLAANVDWAKEKIQKEFLKHNLDDLIKMITDLGIPCGKIGPTEKWLDHPQVKAIGMRAEVKDPKRGELAMPGIPINLTKTPGRVHGPAPEAGADNGKITLRPAPPRPDKTPALRPGPLAGYRILDMGTFVAGPYCGSLLSELGADVIKVEPLTGDPFRATGFTYNRGMRSVAMDLQNKDGREAFYEMVKISDVVIDSLRPGVTRKLGIDFEKLNSLKARRRHRLALGLWRRRAAVAAARRRHGAAGDERHDDDAGRRRRSGGQHHRHHRRVDGGDVRAREPARHLSPREDRRGPAHLEFAGRDRDLPAVGRARPLPGPSGAGEGQREPSRPRLARPLLQDQRRLDPRAGGAARAGVEGDAGESRHQAQWLERQGSGDG